MAVVQGSAKVRACFTPPCGLGTFSCNDGPWVRVHMLSPALIREILSLDCPKQNINPQQNINAKKNLNPSMSYCYMGRRHMVMGPAHAALTRSKVWLL